ncbi:hypothetical protein A1D31_23610 [Bradyrhizobium liaoningense]|nr:hypothetical protein A1D31_23610 [Bradyrhizobium liaoningense]
MPLASAVRTASAVGADMPTTMPAPIAAVFCTISTDIRLVRMTAPVHPDLPFGARAPASLSSALCATHVLADQHGPSVGFEEPRGMGGASPVIEDLRRGEGRNRRADLFGGETRAVLDSLRDPAGFAQAVDAAQPAPRRPDELPPSLLQPAPRVRS